MLFTTVLVAPIAYRFHREEFGRLSRRDIGFAVLAGVALAVHFATWFESLNHTSVAASGLLGEVPGAITLVGGIVVLTGIYATTRECESPA